MCVWRIPTITISIYRAAFAAPDTSFDILEYRLECAKQLVHSIVSLLTVPMGMLFAILGFYRLSTFHQMRRAREHDEFGLEIVCVKNAGYVFADYLFKFPLVGLM